MSETPAEYTARRDPRRSRHRATNGEIGRLRTSFFVATAVWGFLAGAVGYAASRGVGAPVGGGISWGGLLLSAAIALVGSIVFARAYDELRRRRS